MAGPGFSAVRNDGTTRAGLVAPNRKAPAEAYIELALRFDVDLASPIPKPRLLAPLSPNVVRGLVNYASSDVRLAGPALT